MAVFEAADRELSDDRAAETGGMVIRMNPFSHLGLDRCGEEPVNSARESASKALQWSPVRGAIPSVWYSKDNRYLRADETGTNWRRTSQLSG